MEAEWFVDAAIGSTGWGLEPRWHQSDDPTGARGFDPVLLDRRDLAKLRYPEYTYDKDATDRAAAEMEELFGDILAVKRRGVRHISFHLMSMLTCRRGLAETMMDMADNPQFVHDAMAFFAEGERRRLGFLVDNNLLSLNNDSTYHSSGGNGYTADLPAAGFDPGRVRPGGHVGLGRGAGTGPGLPRDARGVLAAVRAAAAGPLRPDRLRMLRGPDARAGPSPTPSRILAQRVLAAQGVAASRISRPTSLPSASNSAAMSSPKSRVVTAVSLNVMLMASTSES